MNDLRGFFSMKSVYIEFSRAVKSRAELGEFEKFCKTHPTTKRHFTHVEGRKFYFQFPNKKEADIFLDESQKMIESKGMITERVYAIEQNL